MATTTHAASALGQVLARLVAVLSAVRRTKPLHPEGEVTSALLTTWGTHRGWGAPLLDEEGVHECLVRRSRAVGLPSSWPDIGGLALRVAQPGRPADLLFATTGSGLLGRWFLLVRRDPSAPLTTLLPLRSRRGAVQLRLEADGEGTWEISAASPRTRRWQPFGRLRLTEPSRSDAAVRFDPVHDVPRGLAQYPAWRAVREPGYARAQAEPVAPSS